MLQPHGRRRTICPVLFHVLNTSGFCKMAAISSGFLSLSGWCMSKQPSVTHLQCQVSAWLGLANGTAKLGNGLILRPHMARKPKSWLGIGRKWYSILLSPNLKLSTWSETSQHHMLQMSDSNNTRSNFLSDSHLILGLQMASPYPQCLQDHLACHLNHKWELHGTLL